MQTTIVLFAVFAATVGNTTVFATLGLHGRSVGLSEFEVGAIFASSGVLFFLTSAQWGRLSDRVGRGPVMAAGLVATALSLVLFAGLYGVGGTFLALLLARGVYGLLAGSVQPAATAWMAEHARPDRLAGSVALVGAAAGIASIAGPILVAGVVGSGLAAPVAIGGGLAAVAAVATLAGLRGGHPTVRPPVPQERINGLMPYLVVAFVTVLGFGALQPTTAFYVQDRFGLATADAIRQAGYATAGFAAGAFVVQAFVVRSLTWPSHRLLSLGLVICGLAVVGALAASSPPALIAAFGIVGTGYGWRNPA